MGVAIDELLQRVLSLEGEMKQMKDALHEQDKADMQLAHKVDSLAQEVSTVRLDVVAVIQEHNQKMWRLVMVLVTAVTLLAGLKLGPDIMQGFVG